MKGRFRQGLAPVLALLAGVLQSVGGEAALPFRTGILPLLTKAGCNSGACHGAATGQGGFKLSLLGYDPEEDYGRITRERGGRRLDYADPPASLVLRKPSGQLEHEGGRRWPQGSPAYQAVRRWIESGAPFGPSDLHVTALAVVPQDTFLATTQQTVNLQVTATLSDGSRAEVTALALYSSNDEAIAEVGKQGRVRGMGRGVTSVMVRYAGQVAAARVTVPFGPPVPGADEPGAEHWIDRQIEAELGRLGLPCSPRSGDGEFLRRVHLDLIGRLPTPEEARAFLRAPATPEQRRQVIDALLVSGEFVDFWTLRLADLLLIGGKRGSEDAARTYHAWLRDQVARNAPWDELTRQLLTAAGAFTEQGPANFFALATDPRDLAEHAGRIFLGTQIACARCHAHPVDRWTQEDYHRFAAYFARVTRDGGILRASARGEVEHPKSGEPLTPRPLGARPAATGDPGADRRLELARWMTGGETPQFARTFVNRVWKHLLGRGLVEPVDDLRPTNPATHPALLDALAQEFARQGYDLRRLVATIASTRAYQRSARSRGLNRLDDRFYSRALVKELPAPVFLDAVAQVTGVPDTFPGYPEGTRAVQLVGARTPSYALDVLGRCSREANCEGGARRGGGLAQALHLINGPTLNAKLQGGLVAQVQGRGLGNREIIEEFHLRAFTRRPEPAELAEWERHLATAPDRNAAVQDLLWAVLNSREFAFNH